MKLWMVTAPGHAAEILNERLDGRQPYDISADFGTSISDAHGVWIGGADGLYLVSPTGSISRVFGSESVLYPANGCI